MTYGCTTECTDFGPDDWKTKALKSALFFIPRACPDHEPLYPRVRKWYVEVDESGSAHREVGVDSEGRPLFAAPDNRNSGFWTDSPKIFVGGELAPVEASEFERLFCEGSKKEPNQSLQPTAPSGRG